VLRIWNYNQLFEITNIIELITLIECNLTVIQSKTNLIVLEEKISDQRKQNRHRQFQRSEIAGKIPKLSSRSVGDP
jgi:hypothetical protein